MKIDEDFLVSIGLSNLTTEEKNKALVQIADIFQFRLGEKISENLSEAQLDEFEKVVNSDHHSVQDWVQDKVPNYEEIGNSVLADLQTELQNDHLEILGL